jgi:hypothetical protein
MLIALVVIGLFTFFSTDINLGIRYLLPLYPLAFILIARLWTMGTKLRAIATVLIVALAIESVSICPRYLTFFNVLAGGPSHGWKIVNDSNFDWGQGLLDLKKWIDQNHAGRIELAYFGMVDPDIYGIDYAPFGEGTDGRFVAISSYFLVGQRQRSASTHGEPHPIQIPFYRELQKEIPVAVPGGSIFIFTRQQVDAARNR